MLHEIVHGQHSGAMTFDKQRAFWVLKGAISGYFIEVL